MFSDAEKVWGRGGKVRTNLVTGECNSQPGLTMI